MDNWLADQSVLSITLELVHIFELRMDLIQCI